MTSLSFDHILIRSARLGGESELPSLMPMINVQTEKSGNLDDEDEIYSDIGKRPNIFPYRQQDLYDRRTELRSFRTAVLENDCLRAVFLPELGGRLWSLFDKKANRELLYVNDVVRYCNLALRNAWFSGGVEWNLGMIGHTPFTCEPLFTARLQAEDGTPVLRMYEYERLRGVTYQMDFSLPEHSPLLLCRMRIHNLQNQTIPMYWWSNIAVPESPDRRVIVPAESAYFSYCENVSKTSLPLRQGRDVTYPVNTDCSRDFFYRIPDRQARKFIACLNKEGYGLVQTSTSRLKGRKLFVWGQSQGGQTWQNFLTDHAGNYVEIQAGLARTQYECLPMPPLCAWEWVEAYGPMQADPSRVHNGWAEARQEVEERLDQLLPRMELEHYLETSKTDYALKKGEIVTAGSGFGALEDRRRRKAGEMPLPEHLDFGAPGKPQEEWAELLETGRIHRPDPREIPPSYLSDEAWLQMLRQANMEETDNWYSWYQEGMLCFGRGDYARAEQCLLRSAELQSSCWSSYGLAACRYIAGDLEGGLRHILEARRQNPKSLSLNRDVFRFLQENGQYKDMVALYETLPEAHKKDGKCKFYLASALAHQGEIEKAEAVLYENGCLVVPNIREGELSLTSLWFYIEEQKCRKQNRPFDETSAQPPAFLDFRMGYADN